MIAALGLLDDLVGVTHSCDFPPQVRELAQVTSTTISADATSREIDHVVKESVEGGSPLYELDVALLASLEPELVVTQAVCDVCAVGESQAMSCLPALPSTPEVVSLHPHRFADVLADLVRLGRAAGVEERARRLVSEYRSRVDTVCRSVRGRRRVDVVVLEWIDPLFSAGHWTPDIVEMAGGRELLARPGDRSRELSWEEVLGADPEVLVLACCGQDIQRTLEDLDRLEALPGFAFLRAAREGRVHAADGGAHFSRPGPRLVDSLELLAETLHPAGRDSAHDGQG